MSRYTRRELNLICYCIEQERLKVKGENILRYNELGDLFYKVAENANTSFD